MTWMENEHTLEEYAEKVLYLKELRHEVDIHLEHVVSLGIYEMHRDELINSIMSIMDSLIDIILTQMTKDYQHISKKQETI